MQNGFYAAYRGVLSLFKGVFQNPNTRAGKVTLFVALGGAAIVVASLGTFFEVHVPKAIADDLSTSVTVLNTPPNWTVDAQEFRESSTSTPTNVGFAVVWTGTGTDDNNDSYYLLICKTGSAPTANVSAAPTCNGGVANQWTVSSLTTSATQAVAATTTKETFPFNNESNAWFAWICDANVSLPQCNAAYKQGSGTTVSPFVVNHPPAFSLIVNTSPVSPGANITWTATATDTDQIRGGDTLKLAVCKAQDFATSTCGAGGTWAISSFGNDGHPATTTTISIPTQDKIYQAYVYVFDNNLLSATSTYQASSSPFTVNNVAPSVTAATISLVDQVDGGDLTLFRPHATSGPFAVQFTVVDNNSCLNASSGSEFASTTVDIYRSGVTQASCQLSGDFNSNSCYPSPNPYSLVSCTQDGGTCSGASDTDATWTCTFALWYNADPTDASTQFTAENWLASVQAHDDNASSSPLTEATTGNEVDSFLAFDVSSTSIAYGGLQPGQQNDPLATTTDLQEYGNIGLDEDLYGDTMCTTWTSADSCDAGGPNAGTKIPIANQKAATSSVAYASSFAYALGASTTPTSVDIHVQKTTATSSPQTKNTWWGIHIPVAITLAGAYSGQNTITAKKSSSAFW